MISIGALSWRVLAGIKRARRERANDVGTSLAKSQEVRQIEPEARNPSGKDQGSALVIRRWPDWDAIEAGEKEASGSMGIATARQGAGSIDGVGNRSFNRPGGGHPDFGGGAAHDSSHVKRPTKRPPTMPPEKAAKT